MNNNYYNSNLVFAKDPKTGHYRYMDKKEFMKKHRKNRWLPRVFYFFLFIGLCFFGYSIYTGIYEVYIVNKEVAIDSGSTYQIDLLPKNADYFDYKNYVFESENESIASVDKYGEITAKSSGETNINVRFKNDYVKKSMLVYVTDIKVEKLEVVKTINLSKNSSQKVSVKVNDQDNVSTKLKYESSNPNVMTVDELGNITGVSAGTAILKVSSYNGIVCETKVVVSETKEDIQEITLSDKELSLNPNNTKKIFVYLTPGSVSEKDLIWSSSDPSVASVDENGYITTKKPGRAVITVKTTTGLDASCVVLVKEEESELVISSYNEVLITGSKIKLTANKEVTWTSSDVGLANVDKLGNVTTIKSGNVQIIATDSSGKKCTCNIVIKDKEIAKEESVTPTVVEPVVVKDISVTGIEIHHDYIELTEGEERTIYYTVSPKNATNQTVIWKSENTKVATVDNGVVKGVSKGSTVISATTNNGISASVSIVVRKQMPTSIALEDKGFELTIGDKIQLPYEVKPENADVDTLIWSTSDPSVVSINEKGYIEALKTGTSKITVQTQNGIKSDVTITVKSSVVEVTSVKLNKTSTSIYVGESERLRATVSPDDATTKKVTWKSSDPSVATVTTSGIVKGIKDGSATITATSTNGKKASCKVIVSTKVVEVTSLSFKNSSVNIKTNEKAKLEVVINPSDATDKTITYTSNNTGVATVDKNGMVTGKKAGTVTITAKSSNGKTATCKVTVSDVTIEVISIALKPSSLSIDVGKTKTIGVSFNPSNATNQVVTWTSSNKDIATVSSEGVVKGVKPGSATITAKSSNGKTAICKVTVNEIVPTKIEIVEGTFSLVEGKSKKLSIKYYPENSTVKKITWTSSNSAVATVDSAGTVKAVKPGTAKITATLAANTNIKSEVIVKVTAKTIAVTGITLDKTNATVKVNSTIELKATITPSGATDKTITWTSSNKNIATVSSSGVVTGVKEGNATITAKSSNGKTATCAISVKPSTIKLKSIKITSNVTSIYVGGSVTLGVEYDPTNATNKAVTWTSSDKTVATVTSGGVVKAIANGSVKITATSKENSNIKASISLTVREKNIPVESIILNKTFVRLNTTDNKEVKLTPTITPSNATNKTLTWTSSNTKVATVDANGKVKALGPGAVKITAKNAESGKSAIANIVITQYDIVDQYDSQTLKYFVERPSNYGSNVKVPNALESNEQRYLLFRIWVDDAYNQIKTTHSRIINNGAKRTYPLTMLNNAINRYGYQNKGLIAVNASGFGWNFKYPNKIGDIAASYVLNADNNGSYVSYKAQSDDYTSPQFYSYVAGRKGIVLYDAPTGTQKVYGLTKNNQFKTYYFSKDAEKNKELKEAITADGVKYTFNFGTGQLLKKVNGEMVINNTSTDLASRTALCQIDKNNFIVLETTMTPGTNNNQYGDYFRYYHGLSLNTIAAIFYNYGCTWAVNLDGGGSCFQSYKKGNDTSLYRYFDNYGKVKSVNNSYGEERQTTDLLYFVEK